MIYITLLLCEVVGTNNSIAEKFVASRLSHQVKWNFTTARESGNILFTYLKAFSSDTNQSMKTSDNDLKANQNIYPDAVFCRQKEFVFSLELFK